MKHAIALQSHALFLLGTESTHPPESLTRIMMDVMDVKFRGRDALSSMSSWKSGEQEGT